MRSPSDAIAEPDIQLCAVENAAADGT
jgi:hypothetical protein